MSFLTPLYIAGLLAVSLPILFHLIRRTPQGRVPFSSLMFLQPSPPQITRRRRVDNWLLLLLRAAALCLLAFAFARPFFRETAATAASAAEGRSLAILLDTSASMRRGDLWTQARNRAEKILEETTPGDRVGIFSFDRGWKPLLDFEEWSALEPEARAEIAGQRLKSASPGWSSTDLGLGLAETAEALDAVAAGEEGRRAAVREMILISDFQAGSRIQNLQAFSWPESVSLTVEQVKLPETTNAGLQLLAGEPSVTERTGEESIRVRISNASDSTREQFRLRWSSAFAAESGGGRPPAAVDVYVPPGTSRVVRIPVPATGTTNTFAELVLAGDGHDFDNRVYVDRPPPETLTVWYFGSDAADDPRQSRYFLERAFPTQGRRVVDILSQNAESPPLFSTAEDVQLVVVTEAPPEGHLSAFQRYLHDGGTLLYVAQGTGDCRVFGELMEWGPFESREADGEEYALLGEIDYDHPMFEVFSDARYADFTKVRFWNHRVLAEEKLPKECRIAARFDDGSPAVVEAALGSGTALLLTAGWRPAESQLATSSKFVPLINSLLNHAVGRTELQPYYTIGDAVPLQLFGSAEAESEEGAMLTVQLPDESEVLLASGQNSFQQTVVPGIYRIRPSSISTGGSAAPRQFAVNLAPEESKTAPLEIEQLEALDVRLTNAGGSASPPEAIAARQRQMKARELENRQKLWQWLIVAALGILLVETLLAGVLARRRAAAPAGE